MAEMPLVVSTSGHTVGGTVSTVPHCMYATWIVRLSGVGGDLAAGDVASAPRGGLVPITTTSAASASASARKLS